ncbi:MAG: hypothetical protein QOJ32_1919 [Frankiaceae bacterium]|nr:hypothetical protein [Frankiaceae bacterium]
MTTRLRDVSRPVGGATVFALTLLPLRRDRVGPLETGALRRMNGLPDRLHLGMWLVMQCGSVGAVPAAGALALVGGSRRAAARLVASGLIAYLTAKAVKRMVRRGRPAEVLSQVRVRGKAASGGGYVSGHAAVSMALARAASDVYGSPAFLLPAVVAPLAGTSRVYVGAHLPLDVLGGAALGWTVDGLLRLLMPHRGAQSRDPGQQVAALQEIVAPASI